MRAGLCYCDNHVVMKFFSNYWWWLELADSLRLLRLHGSFLQIIKIFTQIEKTKQEICKVFKAKNLNIMIEANKKNCKFLRRDLGPNKPKLQALHETKQQIL